MTTTTTTNTTSATTLSDPTIKNANQLNIFLLADSLALWFPLLLLVAILSQLMGAVSEGFPLIFGSKMISLPSTIFLWPGSGLVFW